MSIKDPIFHVPSRLSKATPHFTRPDIVTEPLYVVCATFNPERSRKLMKNAEDFYDYIVDRGAILYSIEASFGERNEIHKEERGDRHVIIHVRTTSQLWLKENLQNVAVRYLPAGWKYVAFIDPDVRFLRDDIVGETIQQLQHFAVLQMFTKAWDTNRDDEVFSLSYGFVHDWYNGYPMGKAMDYLHKQGKYNRFHTGYAWAMTAEAFNNLGGLFDKGILGSGDNHMAKCLIGQWDKSVNMGVTQQYKDELQLWQDRALKYIKSNIGYVKGDLIHKWHGAKSLRGYKSRWMILVNNKYNPVTDIKLDSNGVYQLVVETPRQEKMRNEIRQYFRNRNDDSTHLDNGSALF